jgi:hypothetical protein
VLPAVFGPIGPPSTRGYWHRKPSSEAHVGARSAASIWVVSQNVRRLPSESSTLLRHAGRLAAEIDCRVQAKAHRWLAVVCIATHTTAVPEDVCGPERRVKTLDRTLKSASRAPFRPSLMHTRREAAHRCSYERPLCEARKWLGSCRHQRGLGVTVSEVSCLCWQSRQRLPSPVGLSCSRQTRGGRSRSWVVPAAAATRP